jgi:hypothetical protein
MFYLHSLGKKLQKRRLRLSVVTTHDEAVLLYSYLTHGGKINGLKTSS